MASLIHFEEKVHRKKLQRADTIPLLFPSTSGVPTHKAGDLSIKTIPPTPTSPTLAPPVPMPEATSRFPMTPTVPPVAPTTSEPSITISTSDRSLYSLDSKHMGLLPPPQPDLPTSSEPLAPTKDTIPAEDTTTVEVQIPPP
ncbi:hypothetical protein AAG906_006844 [Vitis piasezkii]